MMWPIVPLLAAAGVGLAGAFFYEIMERTQVQDKPSFWLRVVLRTLSWACLGSAGIMLANLFQLSG